MEFLIFKYLNYGRNFINFLNLMADRVANRVTEQMKHMFDSNKQESSSMKLYTVNQVCDMLHISKSKLYRHKKEGRLVPVSYTGRNPLFSQASIDNNLNSFVY